MPKIQFTSGCPNNCQYCYEDTKIKTFDPKIPITKELIQILDMNFLANPKHLEILRKLPKQKYELVCGLDYRRLTPDICSLLKNKGFIKIRWAWDYSFYSGQKVHKYIRNMFVKAGYKPEKLAVFIIVNWKIPYTDCMKKLDLLKIWNVQVRDCCYNGGYSRALPIYWTPEHIKKYRAACRKHNQMIIHRLDPELL